MLRHEELSSKVIGAAIEVHREIGPGLLESAYEACLCRELSLCKIGFEKQVPLPLDYKGHQARLRVSDGRACRKDNRRGNQMRGRVGPGA